MQSGVASLDILPTSIAYSTLRTTESLVLHDAREDPHYGRDAYIIGRQSRSIMCVPLIKQGSLSGLLYKENSLMAGIFTTHRLQMLEVLASQAAISLENARLYEDLEAENRMRAATESHLRETQQAAEIPHPKVTQKVSSNVVSKDPTTVRSDARRRYLDLVPEKWTP